MRQDWSEREVAEVDSILARLEEAKRRIIELEKRKLDLSHEERRLNDQYEEDELRYRSMVNGNILIQCKVFKSVFLQLQAKQSELKELQEQYYSMEVDYRKIETDNSSYLREVDRYGRIITGDYPLRVKE